MLGKKPNVIVFFSDQQRWDTLGCYGQKLNITPNLDRMAQEGVRFENAFTCQPVCGPARACIQTGRYATQTGCFRNDIGLPLSEKTLANYFSEAGYETAYIGKWHLASTTEKGIDYQTKAIPPERRGGYQNYWLASDLLEFTSHGYGGYLFDGEMNRVDFTDYRVDCITDFVLDYLDNRKSDKPFFLFISYIEPHHQNDRNCYEGPIGSKVKYMNYQLPGDLQDTDGDWEQNFSDYLGCCNSLDYNLGRLREKLEALGISGSTDVIYTSDHGSHFRTRNKELAKNGYDDYKRSCHEGCIRIPMIAAGPHFTGGKVIEELVSLMDLPSTLLKCADIDKPESMAGQPLNTLVEGTAESWPQEVFLQISESHVARAVRTKKWKYCVNAPDKDPWKDSCSEIYQDQFLYDLEADPFEKNNLIADPKYSGICNSMADLLKRRMVEAGEQEPIIVHKCAV